MATQTIGLMRRDRTRLRLVGAARSLFTGLGYEKATIDDIVREAGYSKGAYYFHFASKEDVLLAVVDDWAESRSKELEGAEGSHPPDIALRSLLETLLSPEATENGEARLLLEFWGQGERNPRVSRRLAQVYRSWREILVRAFRRAQEAGVYASQEDPQIAADAALALHDGLAVQACIGLPTGGSAQERADASLELLAGPWTAGVRNARERPSPRAAG